MSPTTEDLRRRMSDELGQFPTLPDLTTPALAGGRRRRRHRRVAVGGAAVVGLVVAPLLFLVGQPDRVDDHPTTPADVAADPTNADATGDVRQRAARIRAEAEADGVVTDTEWSRSVVATLDALLPRRFGGVDRTPNDAVVEVRTRAGSPRLDLWMSVSGYEGSRSSQPASGGCAQVEQAAADSDAPWDILDCADARFGDGFQALGTSERIVGGSRSDTPGSESYAGALLLLDDQLFVEVGISPVGKEAPLSVSADELVELGRDPDFLDLVREGVAYASQRVDAAGSGLVQVEPVWPS
ncbi:hypothetical protein [Nocardioides sp.]|uniref:hypothetical protein n=1 Tax=Nocardioides sp. TaxID=35761 RepID=UPI0037847A2F